MFHYLKMRWYFWRINRINDILYKINNHNLERYQQHLLRKVINYKESINNMYR